MELSRIVAVGDVELEADPGAEPHLIAFYRDAVALELVGASVSDGSWLRFRSGRIELRYTIIPAPRLSPLCCRLVVAVRLLRQAREMLDERHIGYERIHGLSYTDRRLSLLDPAGNRIELKQDWPAAF